MKITTFITGIVFIGFNALATDTPTTPTCPTSAQCATSVPSPTASSDGEIKGFGQEWLNIDTVTVAAANGDPIAQYTLAYLTDSNAETPQDKEKATQMYAAAKPGLEAAAAKGHPAACRALAHMCMHGNGCDKNAEQAQKYMQMCKDSCKKPMPKQQ